MILSICSAVLVFLFVWLFIRIAPRLRLIDFPGERKKHGFGVPAVGGLAIYPAVCLAALAGGVPHEFEFVLLTALGLVVLGALDDALELRVRVRLLAQIFVVVICALGTQLGIVYTGVTLIDQVIQEWALTLPLTIVVVVGLINAFNMSDGIDGLASGQVLLSLSILAGYIYVKHGEVIELQWSLILIAAVVAFFMVNMSLTPMKKIFLGDSGSLLVGYLVAWTLIVFSQKTSNLVDPVVALWCITIPVFDVVHLIGHRLSRGHSAFKPDRFHLHHILMDKGLSSGASLSAVLLASWCISLLGIAVTQSSSPAVSILSYGFMILLYCVAKSRFVASFK